MLNRQLWLPSSTVGVRAAQEGICEAFLPASQEFVLGMCTQVSELPHRRRWGVLGVLGQLLGELPGLVL